MLMNGLKLTFLRPSRDGLCIFLQLIYTRWSRTKNVEKCHHFFLIWYPVTISTGTLLVYKNLELAMQVKLPRVLNSLSVPRNHYQNNKKNEKVQLIWCIVSFITHFWSLETYHWGRVPQRLRPSNTFGYVLLPYPAPSPTSTPTE